jgi:hypothetical protein
LWWRPGSLLWLFLHAAVVVGSEFERRKAFSGVADSARTLGDDDMDAPCW